MEAMPTMDKNESPLSPPVEEVVPEETKEEKEFSSFPGKEILEKLSSPETGEDELMELLVKLDASGLLIAPGETKEEFGKRLEEEGEKIALLKKNLAENDSGEPLIGLTLSRDLEIPEEILEEGAETTRKYYDFAVKWVPGYYPLRGLGALWGGCSISSSYDTPTLFVIRKSFMKKKKFFVYEREELISHELCHVARVPMEDSKYEEFFAYAHSRSALRRYTGNCFKSEKDAIFFILPIFFLLFVQISRVSYLPDLPAWPFWILAFVWPVFLLFCNMRERKRIFGAKALLEKSGSVKAESVLFRCNKEEIESLASIAFSSDPLEKCKAFLEEKKHSDLRWKVIRKRFFITQDQGEKDDKSPA